MVRLLRLKPFLNVLLIFPTLIAAHGCGRPDAKSIESLLERREDAIEARNPDLYLTCISPVYNEAGQDIEGLQAQIRSTFRTFDSIEIEATGLNITIEGDKARASQMVHLIASAGSERRERQYEEILSFRKELGEWKITGGL
ncbi:nuclear transport factor 2 family protein [Thermodesulfobacteriota bacterium]